MGEQPVRERIRAVSGWRISRQLGRGQYGTAYLVEWNSETEADKSKKGDTAVAKVVGLEFLPEKERAMAFQEVELLKEVQHPGVVGLWDHFVTQSNLELVIVMEFCDGGDLRGEVKRRTQTKPPNRIPEAQIMAWFVQLTLALNHLHHRHILHRDLKSSNVFLITNGEGGHDVKIGDFGISRVLEGTADVAATVVGTPYYMSPEVCKAEAYGFKSDVWALGCVLYEMCMLKHAFESQSLLGLVYKIVSDTYEPIPSQYSTDLRTLIDSLLDKSHYTRPSGQDLMANPYVRTFLPSTAQGHDRGNPVKFVSKLEIKTNTLPTGKEQAHRSPPQASLGPSQGGGQEHLREVEPSPPPPCTTGTAVPATRVSDRQTPDERPARREWCAPPFAAQPPAANARKLDEAELRARIFMNRLRRALAARRQNWLQTFASFDRIGNGQLQEVEFERAVTSMAPGLSHQEIREVRLHLQGDRCHVLVYEFGQALHRSHPEVSHLEDWGRSVLADLVREAARVEGSKGVAPGATVRVADVQGEAGRRLNGEEGVVESWDATACNWAIRLPDGSKKSFCDENLQVVREATPVAPGVASAGVPCGPLVTTAIYRILCQGGETAVTEANFLNAVERLLPRLDEAERGRLFALLPKSLEGRVDVPEALAQLVSSPQMQGSAQQATLRGSGATAAGIGPGPVRQHGSPPQPPSRLRAGPAEQWQSTANMVRGAPQASQSPMRLEQANLATPPVPGAVPSPRASRFPSATTPGAVAQLPASVGGGSSSSTCGVTPPTRQNGGGQQSLRADLALLRLAQRLIGRPAGTGPGLDVLRLFSERPQELSPDELSHAVSVLPLGISRAEVTGIFNYIREMQTSGPGFPVSGVRTAGHPAGSALPFARLKTAVDAALRAGMPSEAASLERLNSSRIVPALQRLAAVSPAGASPHDFRVTLMQAEPYLTQSQLEWLVVLTDRDGEGRLQPASLLIRLGWESSAHALRAAWKLSVPPRPVCCSRLPIAPHTPRSLVVATIVARVFDRLAEAGPQLTLDRMLNLFDISSSYTHGICQEELATLLGHLRLGISAAEADELVCNIAGGRACSTSGDNNVNLASLYNKVQCAGDPETSEPVIELREAARTRLVGKGSMLAAAALHLDSGEWLPEAEFRQCLSSLFADEPVHLAEEEEERLLLLAEKTASGNSRWRPFAVAYANWDKAAEAATPMSQTPISPQQAWKASPSPVRVFTPQPKFDRVDLGNSTQSWRSARVVASRAVVSPTYMQNCKLTEETLPPATPFCPCRRRCK